MSSKTNIKPIASLHKRALKIIKLKSTSLTIDDYKSLNILPFKQKLQFNKGLFMFKIINSFISPTLKNNLPLHYARNKIVIYPPLPRIDLFKQSLLYSGGTLWNTLSIELKSKNSIGAFKRGYHNLLLLSII